MTRLPGIAVSCEICVYPYFSGEYQRLADRAKALCGSTHWDAVNIQLEDPAEIQSET